MCRVFEIKISESQEELEILMYGSVSGCSCYIGIKQDKPSRVKH